MEWPRITPMAKDQPVAIPYVISNTNLYDIHCFCTIDRMGVVVTDEPIRDTYIAAMIEQLNEISGGHGTVVNDLKSRAAPFG
jgi:hypothetical protein